MSKSMFTCSKCHQKFMDEEMLSTESYSCKKHDIYYTPEKAIIQNYRCSIIPKSNCPTCNELVYIDKLPIGQFYLKCPKCSWNSYTNNPKIHYITDKLVLKEGMNAKIIKKQELCGNKLKKEKGISICPNCFSQFLINGGITSFSTIKNMYNLEPNEISRVINKLKEDKRISGHLDKKNQIFIHIPENAKEYIREELKDKGKISIEALGSRFNIPAENAIELMYDMLKEQQIHGTFDLDKTHYLTAEFLNKTIIDSINSNGRIAINDLSKNIAVSFDIIKFYTMELFKNKSLEAYFADSGSEVVTKEKLKNEILAYSNNIGLFKLNDASKSLKVAGELVRKSIFELIKEQKLRGLFTQKREFITENELSNKIKDITKAYRIIKLRELARRLGITELRVEEILASLISRGAINGYIDMNNHEFKADVRQPVTMGAISIPTEAKGDKTIPTEVEVLREYDFVGGQLHFKVIVKNHSALTISDIKVILDVPSSYNKETDILKAAIIAPKNSRGLDFYLEPAECGISTIGGTVIYKDAMGKPHTIHIRPKEVQIKCPLVIKTLDTIEDCQVAIQSLPSDARAFLIADLDPQLAYRAGFRAITNFDTRNVTSLEIPEPNNYQAEAWFSSEAKVTGGRIITRVAVNGPNQSLEIRVWCNDAGQLTGFLAKIIELLFLEINIVRKVKSEARQKTVDVMSITQNLITASDYCAVRYHAKDILLKMEDIYERMLRVIGDKEPFLEKIRYWIEKLRAYGEVDKISEEDAELLITDIENLQNVLARNVSIM